MYKSPFSDMDKIRKNIELEELAKGNIYPVTIVLDRYDGSYSGAKWLAFQTEPHLVPEEIGGSDPQETIFWREHDDMKLPIGKGITPEQAVKDLMEKAKKYYESW